MAYRDVILADSPLAYYRAEGDWTDEASTHDGTPSGGVTFASGVPTIGGQAGSFDGTGVVTSDLGYLDDWALEVWVKRGNTSSADQVILARNEAGAFRHNYFLLFSGNQLLMGYHNGSGYPFVVGTKSSWDTSLWYHIVARKVGTTPAFFVNGEVDPISSGSLTGTPSDFGQFGFGGNAAQATQYLTSLIDELAVYSTLSDARVVAHYNAGTNPTTGSLLLRRRRAA